MIMFGSFLRACWLGSAPPTLLGHGSRHCHWINCRSPDQPQPALRTIISTRSVLWARLDWSVSGSQIPTTRSVNDSRLCLALWLRSAW